MQKNTLKQSKRIQRTFTGSVIRDKMDKTLVIEVRRLLIHPRYKKRITVTKKYKVHDPKNEYHVGDAVCFVETRPISKEKRWKVLRKA